ncbi:FAD-dependent oxidoreductase [Parabacteroides johnsonii]|jgi:NADPH-dependent 2,4-dienoyl-CoA reductase/sulfur reductase-like enzyme/peroxiredoxin family protein/rhodanese-related sulfurtransferase/TusA-related sulfurtransferase|uniref:Pyridine nucleotide-disulfide oxidoreductase n=1 Tax=Parabacteroides johnsonii TaxID=387661 RepID=A0A9Q5X9D4_9BACT|nr:FAD-dependent oxidoreductase [Parabacteroides johnsonii]OUO06726.1 pyridine nucleotide-disulfide oxidoreductase [Parabacteroides johnsonii]
MNYLIIGGVAGGATVAARLRRMDEKANIILFERGKYVSYANCGLPYYIGDTINNREKLFVQTVKGFTDRFRIDIRTEQEVTAIHPDKKEVEVKNLSTGEIYTETYDKLVLSPGAEPLRPGIEGIGSKKIFTLRNVPDTDTIKNYINIEKPKRAIVVGGGFIGLEMAENLHDLGIQVDVVEMANQVMAPLDFSMAAIVHQQLTDKGVGLHLEDGVSRFEEKDGGVTVHLRSGKQIATDMVLLSIGVRPETKLAKEAGLAIGERGGIAVNDYMQTSDADIYALGDATEVKNLVTGQPSLIPLAGPANKQGRIVADNIIFGNKKKYAGSIGTSIAKVFDLTVAATGANAKLLQRNNIPYTSSYTHGASNAGYYPGAVPMSIKILFDPENGKLLGAQIVGFNGVDKRIEMLEQVIQRGGTVYDLTELEHAYAPPYSSAKDPVNMAGFVAENILKGKSKIIQWRELAELPADTIRIDVRTRDEHKLGSIPGFINIPVDELREHLDELPKDKLIVVSCAVGLRGYLAYRILVQNGFKNVRNLSGGYKTWSVATAPVKKVAPCNPGSSEGANCECSAIPTLKVDACGLMCPGPVMQLKKNYETLKTGEQLQITATDQAFGKDVASWCKVTGAELVALENKNGVVAATIRKQEKTAPHASVQNNADNKTLIVFSDDLDKALASFVIANGAASTGKKVTMFFTFWGLNVIKKRQKPAVSKDIFGKMFGWMLPAHSGKLKLSKMNMGGAGSWMMRLIMKQKRIDSLESLIQQAVDNGVEMIACTMSMDVMGVQKEELMDNVTLGGVASYLERAEEANVNLFI